jgi:hypothetical protein
LKDKTSHTTRDLAAALAANIAAGLVVWISTRSIEYALVCVAVCEGAVILLLALRREHVEMGVTSVRHSVPAGVDLSALIEEVTVEFAFWGISAKTMLGDDKFLEWMTRTAHGACSFKFLLLNPSSPHLDDRAGQERDNADSWRREIDANVLRLSELQVRHGLNLEVRLYDERPSFRCMFVNGDRAQVSWYPPGLQGKHSPLVFVRDGRGSIYSPIRIEFDKAWNAASVIQHSS